MRKRETLERFALYTLTEGKYPTLDTFMSWGFGRSTYYKVRNKYELVKAHAKAAQEADWLICSIEIGYPMADDVIKKAYHDYYAYDKERELYESWGRGYKELMEEK